MLQNGVVNMMYSFQSAFTQATSMDEFFEKETGIIWWALVSEGLISDSVKPRELE
jgi:hypothetical protein